MKPQLRIYLKPRHFPIAYHSLSSRSDRYIGICSEQLRPAVPASVQTVIKDSELEALRMVTKSDNEAIWDRFEQAL